jgi:hypothetical protein
MTTEAIIILLNMRGGCATVGGKVHTLFRFNNRRRAEMAKDDKSDANSGNDAGCASASSL